MIELIARHPAKDDQLTKKIFLPEEDRLPRGEDGKDLL